MTHGLQAVGSVGSLIHHLQSSLRFHTLSAVVELKDDVK